MQEIGVVGEVGDVDAGLAEGIRFINEDHI